MDRHGLSYIVMNSNKLSCIVMVQSEPKHAILNIGNNKMKLWCSAEQSRPLYCTAVQKCNAVTLYCALQCNIVPCC